MKRLMMFAAAALVMATLVPQEASAQRGRGFVAGGGYRVAAIGGYRGGLGVRTAAFAPRYGVRAGLWRPGLGAGWAGWRPGSRWGYPLAAGVIAAGYYGGYGYGYGGYDYGYDYGYGYAGYGYGVPGGCLMSDGYQWISTCTGPYAYRYWW